MIKGIDVSSIQGVIDWQAVAATGIEFCIIRCYVGNNKIDSMYTTNVAGAKAAGLYVMAYNFIFPLPKLSIGDNRDPISQARLHFNATNGELAAIDCEWPVQADFGRWGCSPTQINQWMITYFQEYTRLDNGRKPLIYTFPNWAETIKLDPSFAQYQLWIASYESTPTIPAPWTDWVLWQDTGGTGPNAQHLPNGEPVDSDKAKDLSLWNVTSPIIAAPPPVPEVPAIPDVQVVPDASDASDAPDVPDVPDVQVVPDAPDVPVPSPINNTSSSSNIFTSVWSSISKIFK